MIHRTLTKQSGIAILSSLIFLAIVVVMLGIGTVVGLSNFRLSKDNKATIQAQHAADTAIEQAIYEFWHVPNYLAERKPNIVPTGTKLSIANYKRILDKELDVGNQLTNIYAGENGEYGDPVTLSGKLDNDSSYEAIVRRRDVGNRVLFNIVSKGVMNSAERYVTQNLTFGSQNPWDFAILTDNIECIFCHLEVYSIETGYKADGTLRNFFKDSLSDIHGFERVRVGSIAKLELESSKAQQADSYILGSIYTRDTTNFIDEKAEIYTVALQENTPLINTGATFGSSFKRLEKWDSTTNDSYQDCVNPTDCTAFGKMYTHYPTEDVAQPDGLLQTDFPLPVSDNDANRLIDDREWNDAISGGGRVSVSSKGSVNAILTTPSAAGIIIVGKNEKLGEVNASTSTYSSSQAKNTSSFKGEHLILRGTANSPLEFDGKVYVNGDVIISGRVSGNGMIVARGNVYIVGDIVYDCGNSECDYTNPDTLPRFALSAVGNITSGIYSAASTVYNPSQSPVTLSNDIYYYKKADGQTVTDRFLSQDFGMVTTTDGVRNTDNLMTLAANQMCNFNRVELERISSNPNYKPRFYIFRQGEHDWVKRCKVWHYQSKGKEYGPVLLRDSRAARDLQGNLLKKQGENAVYPGTPVPDSSTAAKYEKAIKDATFITLSPEDHWTLGKYGINEVAFDTQFPSAEVPNAGSCSGVVENYIKDKLFSLKVGSNGEQSQGDVGGSDGNEPDDCYNIAVARERLRAMNAELVLQQMWKTYVEDSGARRDILHSKDSESFRFDGVIYTGNAFLFIVPNNSVAQGEAVVNGSFIAADMGVLVGGSKTKRNNSLMHSNPIEQDARGLRIHYDRRAITLISDVGEGVGLARSSFEVMNVNDAKQYFGGP